MISVVIPTLDGRETLLAQTMAAYEATFDDLEFVIVRNRSTCGEGWNAGAAKASAEYLMLAVDDMAPHEGWAETALAAVERDAYPAPWIVKDDGSTECCGTLGCGLLISDDARDGLLVSNSPVPFMRREYWDDIGPCIPTHYYADDYLAYKARFYGLRVEVCRGYKFTHFEGVVGRSSVVARADSDRALYAKTVSNL